MVCAEAPPLLAVTVTGVDQVLPSVDSWIVKPGC